MSDVSKVTGILLATGLILLATAAILEKRSKREDLLIENRALKQQLEDCELQIKILKLENAQLKYSKG